MKNNNSNGIIKRIYQTIEPKLLALLHLYTNDLSQG